ncbi:MAG: sulfotransferase [Sedimenticola sp.]
MSNLNYSFLDKVLHRLALQYRIISEVSFELDQKIVGNNAEDVFKKRHVFISGLARAGTTVLMRRFYATGLYRSLTYQDMPFVLAPNLWNRIASISKRELKTIERAHGDSLLVNADSPESLDEVFWRVFSGNEYISASYLKPHYPLSDIIDKYRHYVSAILYSGRPSCDRYLCKNNNNILRLSAINQAFPDALILIPFRDPIQHAFSLLRQHIRFSEIQEKSDFSLSYMNWLVHHEFGLDHRPFQFNTNLASKRLINNLDYWLELWCNTYDWLEKSKPDSAIFVCYEELCTNNAYWGKILEIADIDAKKDTHKDYAFKLSSRAIDLNISESLMDRASKINERLLAKSIL